MTGESGNLFLELVRQAAQQNWCVRPYCTTCGAMYFRSALRAAGGELGGPLLEALALQTGNFSLVESLILTLRGNAVQHEELLDLARRLAARSQQMQRVLRNACNIETKSPQQWPRAQRG